jgi:hypothetical protein
MYVTSLNSSIDEDDWNDGDGVSFLTGAFDGVGIAAVVEGAGVVAMPASLADIALIMSSDTPTLRSLSVEPGLRSKLTVGAELMIRTISVWLTRASTMSPFGYFH